MKTKVLWTAFALGASIAGGSMVTDSAEAACYRPYYSAFPNGDPKCNCLLTTNGIGNEVCYVVSLPGGGTNCVVSYPCAGGPLPL